ncbi:hypothetical protein E2C01_073518 [Portunus trituberculatus]|uniref:Uncharacterized protein n=1 Tax=Portunus trituberculatus TaxID=210409 RepID=A0A5B7IBW7_PORTR|nr:hypothetical protein [Portunus trituberculatus]
MRAADKGCAGGWRCPPW